MQMAASSMRLCSQRSLTATGHSRHHPQRLPCTFRIADSCEAAPLSPALACTHRNQWHNRSAACCQASSSGRVADPVYMKDYQHLKDDIIGTARKAGGGLAAYLLIAVDGEAGLCALIGSAACNLYLLLLYRDVDAVTPDTRVMLWEAEKIEGGFPRTIAKVFAAYTHALRPRLLVPIALGALTWAWNQLSPETPIDTLHQGCMLAGFLSYKIPLVIKIADDNLPKAYKSEEMDRPLIDKFDDNLDQWGRPKQPLVPLPTEALPDNIDTSQLDLDNKLSVKNVVQLMGFKLKSPDMQQQQQQQEQQATEKQPSQRQ